MLKKRIIPCLDIKDGRTVKGVNFVDLTDAGDPVELAKSYVDQGADELVFLDITATIENRKTLLVLVERISKEINIPFTVGGGISTIVDVSQLIQSGADKVSINSAAVRRPELITEIAETYGSQCCVVAIDTKNHDSTNEVFINGGRKPTGLDTRSWASEVAKLGAGEILLTSMNHDGSKIGFDHDITSRVASSINIPVIASGGAGTIQHFTDVFTLTTATGALAASVFHYGEILINDLKQDLKNKGIPIR